jgi:uncharacterized FlaG/YvyC family protein
MSGINSISSGSFPIVPQPAAGTAGTIPATGDQIGLGQAQGTGRPATPDQLQKVIDRMNQQMTGSDHSVRIGYASSLHRLTVEVVDNSTGQVVGQFPSKSVINSEVAMNQYIGMILSKEA